jgi:sulfatase modifying factor 1
VSGSRAALLKDVPKRLVTIPVLVLAAFVWAVLPGCRRTEQAVQGTSSTMGSTTVATVDVVARSTSSMDAGAPPPWQLPSRIAPPSRGMVWIPPGTLIAGTAIDVVPRKADAEMRGEQVVLDGFYMDEYAHPNEQGAIPTTGVSFDEAQALCEAKGKRLCSELEWERGCKGPTNSTYEYGDRYQPVICGTGGPSRPLPAGYRFGCRSEFGVHDLHGSLWEWTSSPWGRGTDRGWITQRGGNGPDGDVVGRCANARYRPAATRESDLGFRCCSGPRNQAEVTLERASGEVLRRVGNPKRDLLRSLERQMPPDVAAEMRKRGVFRVTELWEWKPVANEDLVVAAGCAGTPDNRRCGVLLVRRTLGRLDNLSWVQSGRLIPSLKIEYDPLRLWVYGGDLMSHYRVPVDFAWGRVAIGEPERQAKKKKEKSKPKTKAKVTVKKK